jgi:hypothetical protein
MTGHLKFQILHLKGDYRPEDFPPASCSPSPIELSNPSQAARRIPRFCFRSQPISANTESGTVSWLKRKVKQLYPKNQQTRRKWVGFGSPATPDPTPPASSSDGRKEVVGSGLLVHLSTHFAANIINPFQNPAHVNNEHPIIHAFADAIAFEGFSSLSPILLWKGSFALVKCPFVGDIRRSL